MYEELPLKIKIDYGMELRKGPSFHEWALVIVEKEEFAKAEWEEIEDYIRMLGTKYILDLSVEDYIRVFHQVHQSLRAVD